MSVAVALRPDFNATDLRRLAKASQDAAQTRRLLALAEIYDGGVPGPLRRGSAGLALRLSATGCCGSMRVVQMD
jgi:hypothetical protein